MTEERIVLVVEDDRALGRLFTEILRVAGYLPELAQDGEQTLKRLQTLVPALLMLDLQLPDMSGLHVIKRMREDERLKHTKIIVITADLPRVTEARQHADAVLVKPVDYAQIMQALTDLLDSPSPAK
jgi:CheY-like chemotaxis protein